MEFYAITMKKALLIALLFLTTFVNAQYFNPAPFTRIKQVWYPGSVPRGINQDSTWLSLAQYYSYAMGLPLLSNTFLPAWNSSTGKLYNSLISYSSGTTWFNSGAIGVSGSVGTTGQVLTSQGAGVSPIWSAASVPAWSLIGNSGTSAGTNFVGTTDANGWSVRTNNITYGHLDSLGKWSFGGPLGTGFFNVIGNTPASVSTSTGTSS